MVNLPSSRSVELAESSEAMSSPTPARSYALGGVAETDAAFVRSVAWTGGVKWLAQLVSWGSTLLVARMLLPADYGLVGMATVYFGLVTMLSDFGLATAIVTLRQLKDEQISQINSLSVLLGVACFLISLLAAGPLAGFYRNPQVKGVVCVMSLSFLISGFKAIPSALLQRQLRFKTIAWVDGSKVILQSLSTVVFALSGLGYWSLVYGGLVGISSSTMLFVWLHPKSFAWPHLDALRETLVFSKHILVGRISWFVSGNSDFVVAGRVLGEAALGAYNLAWQLASVPIDKISSYDQPRHASLLFRSAERASRSAPLPSKNHGRLGYGHTANQFRCGARRG